MKKSEGTFDITLGRLTKLWRRARKENQFPADSLVKAALSLTGFNNMIIDTVSHALKLTKVGMQLDFGGIAQGYIAQRVIDLIGSKNIKNALVDVSGDIVAIGAPPGTMGWTIGINKPESKEEISDQPLLVSNEAVTTSGDIYQYLEHEGKRYSHILDPRTGYGITSQKNVTVIAGDGITADWLTKACTILPRRKARKLATHMHAGLLINTRKNNRVISFSNKIFRRHIKQSLK